ncbi:type II toxin-antitoxin system HicB family antitoxin [Actinomadura sp. 9N215]|uniref:type II toxin-antitoxin system HicB family antitoxin n=1 Tax=Actinomadura sp. 9N215 TaxID=3375150 RepID=UPI0037A800FA
MNVDDYLAIPYILDVVAVEGPDGEWVCRLEYEELPGCVAEARSPFDALDRLEELREEYIRKLVREGRPVPTPRAALRPGARP